MMRTLAVEEGPRNIRVNAINPGIILTPMADDVIDPAFAARLASHTPLRRNGRSEDVAGTVAWLLFGRRQFRYRAGDYRRWWFHNRRNTALGRSNPIDRGTDRNPSQSRLVG
ncbi:SDR family oxidoreductase [Rhizobium beringeri]